MNTFIDILYTIIYSLLMVLIFEDAVEYINYINVYELINRDFVK